MNHRRFGKKLGRNIKERHALFNCLTRSLLTHGSIQTTETKAKAFIPVVNKLVRRALSYTELNAKRELRKLFNDRTLTASVYDSIKSDLSDITTQLTKIEKVKYRQGDNSLMVNVSFVKPYVLKKAEVKKEVVKAEVVKPKKVVTKKAKKL